MEKVAISSIEAEIKDLEEALKENSNTEDDISFYNNMLEKAKIQLSEAKASLKEVESEVKEAKAEVKEADKAVTQKQKDIENLKKAIASETDAELKAVYADELKELQDSLSEKKEEKKEQVAIQKTAEKKVAKAKEKKPARKKIKEQVEKKVAAAKSRVITVGGKEYNLDDCDDAIEALQARKIQRVKSGKKAKSYKPSERASANIATGFKQMEKEISAKLIEKNPQVVTAVLKDFKSQMNEAFNTLRKIMDAADIAELKKSLEKIDEIVAKYK